MNDLKGDLYMTNFGGFKPKFPIGTSVRIKRVKADTVHDDYGETNGSGVNNTHGMLMYQGLIYRVVGVQRRIRDDKSYWVYMLEDCKYYYAESMLHPIERKEVFL